MDERLRFVARLLPRTGGSASAPSKDIVAWDDELRGFGVRFKPTGAGAFIIQYRNAEGRSKRLTLGSVAELTAEEARKLARNQLSGVAHGADPVAEKRAARTASTVADICDWYLEKAESGKLLGRRRRPIARKTLAGEQTSKSDFRSQFCAFSSITSFAPWRWWKARPFDRHLTETAAMLIFGPLLVLLAIGFFCWLLFTLAVFALPAFIALTVVIWAVHTGAGVFGGVIVGIIAAGAAFGGRMALAFLPIVWLQLSIILLFVAPAAVPGYNATHGIARMVTPSGAWQALFSLVGAIAVGAAALLRFTGMTSPGPRRQGAARG